jgi:hypothetical protein
MRTELIIKRKLANSILPYIFSAYQLTKNREYYLYHSYNYSKEILALFAGYGLSSPIFKSLYSEGATYNPVSTRIGIIGIIAGVLIGLFRFVAGKEDIAKRVIGQKKIIREFRTINYEVQQSLQKDDHTDVINDMISIQKRVSTIVNNALQEEIWIFNGVSEKCKQKASLEADKLLSDWETAEEEGELQETPDQHQ